MMKNRINILPENIANKIAAGEVVQRPESVVKELLENSIDAGANSIEVIIKRAGKSLIQIIDDGIGMSEEDAILCVQKHATSKINKLEDLDSINTLGFRGEALSSIAAVSQLEIKTETKEDDLGTIIRIDDGITIVKEKGSFSKGTSIAVKNLFFNTPARRNFLKTDNTELKHIIDTFNKIALSHPDISFKLYNDDDLIFDYPSGNIDDRICSVFADNMLDALIPVNEKTDFLSITGFVGKPAMLKKSKGDQYVFLNWRYVVSKHINHAVFTAYENILEKGDYPFFILFVELDPKKIDVNVHPSKLEVRFDDEKSIYNFVLAVIKKSLGTHDLVPAMAFTQTIDVDEKLIFNNFRKVETGDFSDRPSFQEKRSYAKTDFSNRDIDIIFSSIPDSVSQTEQNELNKLPFDKSSNNEIYHEPENRGDAFQRDEDTPFIIQLHNKYILSQIKTGLMIIDQHVAHERVLYEKILKRIESNLPFSQQLLFPRTTELDPARFLILKEINTTLTKLGFSIKFFSKNTIVIEGVPDDVKKGLEDKIYLLCS